MPFRDCKLEFAGNVTQLEAQERADSDNDHLHVGDEQSAKMRNLAHHVGLLDKVDDKLVQNPYSICINSASAHLEGFRKDLFKQKLLKVYFEPCTVNKYPAIECNSNEEIR